MEKILQKIKSLKSFESRRFLKRESTLHSNELVRNEQAYLHRKEADLLFLKAISENSLETSANFKLVPIQTKNSLENFKLQISRDVSQLHKKELFFEKNSSRLRGKTTIIWE